MMRFCSLAATEARAGERAVELGAGVGTAGLALAHRVVGLSVTLVELDPALADLARDNALRNSLGDRVQVATLDVAASEREFAAAGLLAESFARVLMNPPFNDPGAAECLARCAAPPCPSRIARDACRLDGPRPCVARAGGHAHADLARRRLAEVFGACAGFGGITVLPVHPRPDAAAIRIIVRAVKASRAPFTLLPGLTLEGRRESRVPKPKRCCAMLRRSQ